MKYEGIVVSMIKNKAIVTTSDFQCFYIKRRPTAYVGKRIEFTEKDIIDKRSVLTKLALGAACMAVLFVIAFVSNIIGTINVKDFLYRPRVFAYVDVDINPSLELEIDNAGNVIRLVPLNEDAKSLAKKLKVSNVSVYKAIENILVEVKKNKNMGSAEKNYILISSTLNNKNESDEYKNEKDKLDTLMNSMKIKLQQKEKNQINVYLVQANKDERKDAQREGISAGRYVLYNKYKNLGSNFSVEDAKKINVNDLLNNILNSKSEKDSLNSVQKPTPSILETDNAKRNEATKDSGIKFNTPLKTPNKTQKPVPTLRQEPTQKAVPVIEPTPVPMKNPVVVYQNTNYNGWAVGLNAGDYNMFQLLDKGLKNDEASSIKIASGYRVTLYEDYNFTGKSIVLTADSNNLSTYGFDNIVSAIKVEPNNANTTPTKIVSSQYKRFESYNYRGQFIRHQSFKARISENVTPFDDSVYKIVPGLADPDCISFESKNFPGYYLMHKDFKIILEKSDGSVNFKECATFRKVPGLADNKLVSFQSYNYPNRYIRHRMFYLQIDEIISDLERKDATYTEIKAP
ncbi:MAG TPA: AbfB domain-containing protein [Pseudobacteroides sp.]|uniref:AbfB domain-containing protein n=1 Tax=Pseudobacteroides sp. TaxID=1968840 RepID=UPI002F931D57